MDITQIPFNKHIEIIQSAEDKDVLELRFKDIMKNHLGTFHASAQYALAEACSGLALQIQFPDLEGVVVPVLRKSETQFKKPASSTITAKADICDETEIKFKQQLERRGRAIISIPVTITDQNNNITMTGRYEWFVQKI